jgi:hypothetical protein
METKVLLFAPTNRPGGLDLLFSSLKRQTYPFTLCMADELANERIHIYEEHEMLDKTIFVECAKQPGNIRALAQAYNNAAELAVTIDFDLMISLQDYSWIPDNGIQMFVEDHLNYKNALITGLLSLSDAPSDDAIENPYGLFSIFKEPLTERPTGISWQDVRGTDLYPDGDEVRPCAAEHWEANWAAIPVELFKQGAKWDLSYDEGIAYENIDFAKTCEKEYNTPCILDKRNMAIGIPHRQIWPEEEEQLKRHSNRWSHEAKWGKS